MKNRIQSFWFGSTISTMEKLSILSFLKNGHTVDIYAYDEISGLPSGVNVLDANVIIDKRMLFLDSSGGVSAFSDWFRYMLLYERGGWWVDLDVICLKPFDIADEFCFASENYSSNYDTGITCCVIKSRTGAEFLKMILEHIDALGNLHNIRWGELGPALIHSVLKKFDSDQFVQPAKIFCPVDWTEMETIVNTARKLPEDSLAIHMWNNLWRINNIDKELSYQPGSIYEQLKLKYL